jgi:hypothetical protein
MKIDKGIPIPRQPVPHRLRYPWPEMEPGDSFFIATAEPRKTCNAVGASGFFWCRRNAPDRRISVRTVEGGVRAWMLSRNGKP